MSRHATQTVLHHVSEKKQTKLFCYMTTSNFL